MATEKRLIDANGVRLESKQATSDENKRWTPVSERLPEHDGSYLVFTKTGCVTTARWYAEHDMKNYRGEFIRHVEGRFHRNATHWMPLPEAPKEDNR